MFTVIQKNKMWKWGFTLIEIMLGMTIFAMLMTAVLSSVQNMSFVRIKTENRVKLLEELYFFSEKLVTNIKEWWSIDYEEYWNRNSYDTTEWTGHYILPSGVGNYGYLWDLGSTYGGNFYLCRSWVGIAQRMWTGGCLGSNNDSGLSLSGSYQRYGQYALQYTDYNGNADSDAGGVSAWYGDEDLDGNITGDEDDKDIGDGPEVLSWALTELYLIDEEAKTRTFFRWIVRNDPNAPLGTPPCIMSGLATGSGGCVGNVQILKLRGFDLGFDHSWSILSGNAAFDGIVDTWVCHLDWNCSWPTLSTGYWNLATWSDSEWVDIFPDTINVKSIKFVAYPKKDPWRAWWAPDAAQWSSDISPFIHPYVRLELRLWFAWWKRRTLKWDDPTISVTTSVSLNDI
jgi:prepilin-type N-terminal cleavage/methylation domain-containing protein